MQASVCLSCVFISCLLVYKPLQSTNSKLCTKAAGMARATGTTITYNDMLYITNTVIVYVCVGSTEVLMC